LYIQNPDGFVYTAGARKGGEKNIPLNPLCKELLRSSKNE